MWLIDQLYIKLGLYPQLRGLEDGVTPDSVGRLSGPGGVRGA